MHAALRCQPPDPVLAHDPPDLRDVDATRHVGRQAEARSVVAIQIQAHRNRGESGTVLRHRPRKVEIVGPNRVEALVHPPDREAHRTAPAEQVLDGRCGAEVLEGDHLAARLHAPDRVVVLTDHPARRVEEVHAGIADDPLREYGDGIWRPQVVAEQDCHELGRRVPHARVQGPRQLAALVHEEIDTPVVQRVPDHPGDLVEALPLGYDDQPPVGARLAEHGVDGVREVPRVVVPDGHERRDRHRRGAPA